jgi:2',3'-cyclic-nucleotide 2'-phosphodiesterase/3'-nucleotidase/5'-nucleotidase
MRPRRSLVLSLAALLASALAPCGRAAAEDARVVILHTTDLHGAFDAWDYGTDRPVARGLTRIATLVRRVRAEGQPTLLVDAGDAIQGGGATLFQRGIDSLPDPMMTLMNAVGYDAMVVGNHEFDFGVERLNRVRSTAKFPWLAANVVREDGGLAFDGSMVRTVGGFKIGIVGVCTPAVPSFGDSSRWAGVRFLEPTEPARREVERLRHIENCDVVILVAHTGLERDPVTRVWRVGDTPDENWGFRLAEQVRYVDAIVLGHTHVVIPSVKVSGVPVTQAGHGGEGLGRIDLRLTRINARAPWVVNEVTSRVLAVTDSVADDSTVAALAARYHDAARRALAAPVGNAPRMLSAPAGRLADNPLWDLIHRAQLEATGAEVSLAALPDPSVTLGPGPLTQRDLLRLYPYENTVGVVQLTGGGLKRVLEQSAGLLQGYDFEYGASRFESGAPAYNFDMAEGVSYVVDATRPAGDRIVGLSYQGAPLDTTRVLKVALNSYREFGGGGFTALATAPHLSHDSRTVRELIAVSLEKHVAPEAASRASWSIRPAFAQSAERPLLDLLVRQQAMSPEEAMELDPASQMSRATFAAWMARVMGPRIGAAIGAPKPGAKGAGKSSEPPISVSGALDLCEKAARAAHYALSAKSPDAAFRRSLLTSTSLTEGAPGPVGASQALGLLANLRYPTLQVLETTDFHGFILQTARERNGDRLVGSSPVLAAWIAQLRRSNPEGTVLLDGGDWYQGTMISNLQFGRPVIEQMNALGYAATAIGNHEFDWSADTLARRIRELRCAALGANMVERKTNRLPSWARADTVFTRRGLKVGVLGLCYRNTPNVTLGKYVAHLRFDDDSATAARLVPLLRKRSDVVVAVGHIPAETDTARHAHGDLARLAHVPGVDLWLGGHSHNQVLDEIGGVPVAIAGQHGEVIAVCDLVVDGLNRKVVERHARLQPTYVGEYPPDSAMAARVARWNAEIGPIAGRVLFRNQRALGRDRSGEAAVGSLIADAMRAAAKADVAMQNSGGLRAELPAGDVTEGAIYEVMPFDNTIFYLELTGAEIRSVLEEGLSFGRVTQVSGIRYAFDLSRPRGSRLQMLSQDDGQPIDPTYHYQVVINNFMAGGGDNNDTLTKGRNRRDTGQNIRDALSDYVQARAAANGGVLDYRPDGRVKRSSATPPADSGR